MELAAIYVLLCFVAGVAGRHRRIGFWGFFFCSLITTPMLSLLFIYFSTPRPPELPAERPHAGA